MINLLEIENNDKYIKLLKSISTKQSDVCALMGVMILVIYSKDIFKNNKELPDFIFFTIGKEYKPYVFKVRTTLVAKLSRFLYFCTEDEIDVIRKNLLEYFIIDNNKILNKKNKNKNENDKLTKWLNG